MNILLIDNGTTLLEKLRRLIPGDEVVHTWRDFSHEDVNRADLVVMSGGSKLELLGNEQEFARELEMVRNARTPVIGICFGCEVITLAFGGTLRKLEEKHKGIKTISFPGTALSDGQDAIAVFENHRWIIDAVPAGFNVLAESKDGPEMIVHESLPVYGLQFHPENFVDETEGDTVFLNVLKTVSIS